VISKDFPYCSFVIFELSNEKVCVSYANDMKEVSRSLTVRVIVSSGFGSRVSGNL